MKPKEDMKCPYCGGREFDVENLGNPATAWKVAFGSQFFRKKELQAMRFRLALRRNRGGIDAKATFWVAGVGRQQVQLPPALR